MKLKFKAMATSLAFIGLFTTGAAANNGFCGNYVQIASNAGACPSCKLQIADNPEILKYFVEANNGWAAELSWRPGDPSRASGRGQWMGTAGGAWIGKSINVTMEAQDQGRTLFMQMRPADGSNLAPVTATYRCTDPGRINAQSPVPSSASSSGRWKFNGFTSDEESEGRGASWSASVDVGNNTRFVLTCGRRSRKIGLAMDGREQFGAQAKAAVREGKGRFGSTKSFIDLVIDGQAYPLVAEYYEMNGELNLDEGYRPAGRIINGLLRSRSARINSRSLAVPISLNNSRVAICTVLAKCRVRQAYCQSKGQ